MGGAGLSRHFLLQDYRAGKAAARNARHEQARDLLGYQHELGADDRAFRQQQHEDTHGLNVDKFGFEQQRHGDILGFEQQKHGDTFGLAQDKFGHEQQQHQDIYSLARDRFGHDTDMGNWKMQLESAQAGLGSYQKTIDPETGEDVWTHQPGVLLGKDFRPTPGPNQFLQQGGSGQGGGSTWMEMLGKQKEEAAPPAMDSQSPVAMSREALNSAPVEPVAPKKPRFQDSEAFMNRFYREKMKPFAREAFNKPFTRPGY